MAKWRTVARRMPPQNQLPNALLSRSFAPGLDVAAPASASFRSPSYLLAAERRCSKSVAKFTRRAPPSRSSSVIWLIVP